MQYWYLVQNAQAILDKYINVIELMEEAPVW